VLTLLRTHEATDDEVLASDVSVHGELIVPSLALTGGQLQLQFDHGSAMFDMRNGQTLTLVSFVADAIGTERTPLNWPSH
jgi:hypothetical protein